MKHVFTAKIIDSHRITIPDPVWQLLGVTEGQPVRITLERIDKETS